MYMQHNTHPDILHLPVGEVIDNLAASESNCEELIKTTNAQTVPFDMMYYRAEALKMKQDLTKKFSDAIDYKAAFDNILTAIAANTEAEKTRLVNLRLKFKERLETASIVHPLTHCFAKVAAQWAVEDEHQGFVFSSYSCEFPGGPGDDCELTQAFACVRSFLHLSGDASEPHWAKEVRRVFKTIKDDAAVFTRGMCVCQFRKKSTHVQESRVCHMPRTTSGICRARRMKTCTCSTWTAKRLAMSFSAQYFLAG